ncbi:hypothetical protein CHS0354_031423 [Potamilus streckersoni]|uniref:Methionine synthase reductase n=1 Tax=Potamilus streckersoni TaxID=2493646 RepID=A0AAE0RUR6_9BIVA|nr:hypothetical protein CHS0354_031423 [Potamilus streckersoni]
MPEESRNCFLLLYGSQTGQAKAIAEEIAEKAEQHGLRADIHCLSQTERKFYIKRESCIVFVVSTTGDGDPPDTAQKFWKRLKKKTLPADYLSHLHYAMLGLGDSNYTNFCSCSKNFDKRLQELGAKWFYPAGWADDAMGLEQVAEPWMDGLWDSLRKQLGIVPSDLNGSLLEVITNEDEVHSYEPEERNNIQNGVLSDADINLKDSIRKCNDSQLDKSAVSVPSHLKENGYSKTLLVHNWHNKDSAINYDTISSDNSVDETDEKCITDNKNTETSCSGESDVDSVVEQGLNYQNQSNSGNSKTGQMIFDRDKDISKKVVTDICEPTIDECISEPDMYSKKSSVISVDQGDLYAILGTDSCSQSVPNISIVDITNSASVASTASTSDDISAKMEHMTLMDKGDNSNIPSLSSAPCLGIPSSALANTNLTIPALSPKFLKLEYTSETEMLFVSPPGSCCLSDKLRVVTDLLEVVQHSSKCSSVRVLELPFQNGSNFPSAASAVVMGMVSKVKVLTAETAVKKTLCVTLKLQEEGFVYQPGDSFSIICPNPAQEVQDLLKRLKLDEKADMPYKLSVLPGTKKKNASIPSHVPESASLRHIFTTCLDIREPPKKALLRALVESTEDESQKRRLQELCSKQGNEEYTQFLRQTSVSILDILYTFPSCNPPVETLIEHLPRLSPRPYSASSSPLLTPKELEFVFNVMDIPQSNGRTYFRKGVCTGWLDQITKQFQTPSSRSGSEVDAVVARIQDNSVSHKCSQIRIPVYARTTQHFHMPEDLSIPLILVGPGTGVAPFVGFLRHRLGRKQQDPSLKLGEVWLIFGCRHKELDFLYRSEMEELKADGILTKLLISFSRDEDQPINFPRYVQDNIRLHGEEIVELLDEKNAQVYVCGDARNMAKDVNQAFVDCYVKVQGLSEDTAKTKLMQLRVHHRYSEDVWT